MGYQTDDLRIKNAFELADAAGLKFSFSVNEEEKDVHPNTVDIRMVNEEGTALTVRGVSLGGGKMKITLINGIKVDFSGEYCALIVRQLDKPGIVAHITTCLSENNVNIAFMRLFREGKGQIAYTIVESDSDIPDGVKNKVAENADILDVMVVHR